MHAHAAVAVERRHGRDQCVELRSVPPLTLRETPGEVHLVGSAAAPLGGDRLRLDIRVGAAATLHLRSVAAMVALPGRTGAASELVVEADLARGATLVWNPQPTIAARGCDHHGLSRLRLDEGAHVLWRDEVVLGRSGERSGSIRQRLAVEVAGGALLRTEVAVGERYPGSEGPAGTAGAGAVGSLLLAGPAASSTARATFDLPGVRIEVLELDGPGVLLTALSSNAGALQRALDEVVHTWRQALIPGITPQRAPVLLRTGAAR